MIGADDEYIHYTIEDDDYRRACLVRLCDIIGVPARVSLELANSTGWRKQYHEARARDGQQPRYNWHEMDDATRKEWT